MKIYKRIPEFIIKQSFHFAVWLIERFHSVKLYEQQVDELRKLTKGTLGRAIADCLDENKLRLVPGYESHDLKHTLLNFKMTPVDEIRLQAFMIGNGNITFASIAIFTFGFILLPYKWVRFAKDFHAGLQSTPVKTWTIEEHAEKDLLQLRKSVLMTKPSPLNTAFQKLLNAGPVLAMLAGVAGMLYCLPYLFSPVLEDLVGAGFPFVGGAILAGAGLISRTLQKRGRERQFHY